MSFDREHLEELLSRGETESLSGVDRNLLERALREDASLAADRLAYARLNKLLSGCRQLPEGIDGRVAVELALGDVRDEFRAAQIADIEDAAFDESLRDLVGAVPSMDWSRFGARVSDAVRRESDHKVQTYRWPAILTWAAPLAAAAVLVIAIWGPLNKTVETPEPIPGKSMVVVEVSRPTGGGFVDISFDRTKPVEIESLDEPLPGGTVIVTGSWPTSPPANRPSQPGVTIDAYYY